LKSNQDLSLMLTGRSVKGMPVVALYQPSMQQISLRHQALTGEGQSFEAFYLINAGTAWFTSHVYIKL
jgi:hypothetical protein